MQTLDVCAIVASNPAQAMTFRAMVELRREQGLYPRELEFAFLSDPDAGRIGSGGGSILAADSLRIALARGKSVLVIQAGGESRRLPAYAPESKLFAPVPVRTSSRIPPVLLDLQLSLFLRYPWNSGEMVVSSGDVSIDFETDLIPAERGDIYGFAAPSSFEEGSRHGVFRFDSKGVRVTDFYQKEPADFLEVRAPLSGSRSCALDTGLVGFSSRGVQSLLELSQARPEPGLRILDELQAGRLRIDLYREILIAGVVSGSFDDYCRRNAGPNALPVCYLRSIYDHIHPLGLQAFVIRRPRFLHFGTLSEYSASSTRLVVDDTLPFYASEEAELRPVVSESALQFNSHRCVCIPAPGARGICIEGCEECRIDAADGENLLVGLSRRHVSDPLPVRICLDERQTAEGSFLLVYAMDDTWGVSPSWDQMRYCGTPLDQWLRDRSLRPDVVFPRTSAAWDLYQAALFIPGSDTEFAAGFWNPTQAGESWRERFLSGPRFSLAQVNQMETAQERESRRARIRTNVLRQEIATGRGWLSIPEKDFLSAFHSEDWGLLQGLNDRSEDDLVRMYRSRMLRALQPERTPLDAIRGIAVSYLGPPPSSHLRCCVKSDQIVWARSPVRLDLAGGWTDTPPFTLREGGEVVNLAANLNNQPPIQVFCRRLESRVILVHSIDTGDGQRIEDFGSLEDFDQPGSTFALPKAALALLGLTRERTRCTTLAEALEQAGCGVEVTLLSAVPKGSGLGTSSILGGAILAALHRFFGLAIPENDLFRMVLQMEQMLTTGGGWQDQIGGIAGGAKYITSKPGLRPDPMVYRLDPHLFLDAEALSRFTLYYTGTTRLAKDILQVVVDRMNSMEPAYLFTLRSLKGLARAAREAISLRDLAALARVLSASWDANKRVHESTTNDEVEALLASVRGNYAGMKLLGAGGGGFALFLSESVCQAEALRDLLERRDSQRARVVGMTLSSTGLEVTVG